MPATNPAFQAGLARVTEVAVFDAPSRLVVVAHAAEFPLGDFLHSHVVRTRTHLEPQFVVTDLAAKPDAMKPVGKDDGTDIRQIGIPVQNNVAVFGQRRRTGEAASGQNQNQFGTPDQRLCPVFTAGAPTEGRERDTLWHRAHWVSGNATAPWHWPQNFPRRIAPIVTWFAPRLALKIRS